MAVVFAQLEIGGQVRGRARVRRTHPGRGREAARRRPHRGRRRRRSASTASTTAGSGSTACGCRATNLLNRYADVTEDGRYLSDIENVDRRFFTMLGTLIQGRVCVGGAGISASKVALAVAIKYANQRRQFGPPDTDEEELLLDYGMHQRRLLPLLAKTYALHFSPGDPASPSCTTCSPRPTAPDRQRRALESRAAGTKALGHLARQPDHPGVPRGLRRRGLPDGQPARAHCAPTPTCSPPSRATTTSCCSWSPRACSPTTRRTSATSTSSAWCGSWPTSRSRPWSSGPAHTSCSSGSRTCCPAAATTAGTRRPGCSTRSTSSRCSAGARSTSSPAWRGG